VPVTSIHRSTKKAPTSKKRAPAAPVTGKKKTRKAV
jgi:hypothetical protein